MLEKKSRAWLEEIKPIEDKIDNFEGFVEGMESKETYTEEKFEEVDTEIKKIKELVQAI